jgi:hypothetical protein
MKLGMQDISITVDPASLTRSAGVLPKTKDFKTHVWPFDSVITESHVRPHFVLFEAGRKFTMHKANPEKFNSIEPRHLKAVALVHDIYTDWTKKLDEVEDAIRENHLGPLPAGKLEDLNRDRNSALKTQVGRAPEDVFTSKGSHRHHKPDGRPDSPTPAGASQLGQKLEE